MRLLRYSGEGGLEALAAVFVANDMVALGAVGLAAEKVFCDVFTGLFAGPASDIALRSAHLDLGARGRVEKLQGDCVPVGEMGHQCFQDGKFHQCEEFLRVEGHVERM